MKKNSRLTSGLYGGGKAADQGGSKLPKIKKNWKGVQKKRTSKYIFFKPSHIFVFVLSWRTTLPIMFVFQLSNTEYILGCKRAKFWLSLETACSTRVVWPFLVFLHDILEWLIPVRFVCAPKQLHFYMTRVSTGTCVGAWVGNTFFRWCSVPILKPIRFVCTLKSVRVLL